MGSVNAISSQLKSNIVRKSPTVAVIDLDENGMLNPSNMDNKSVTIDPYDKIPDISHQALVKKIIQAKCPAVKFTTSLTDKNLSAVNMSVEQPVEIITLAGATGLPLTKENLAKYRDKVAAFLRPPIRPANGSSFVEKQQYAEQYARKSEKGAMLNLDTIFLDTFERIEDLNKKHVPVYIAAGNEGKEKVNMFSFAKGVTTVGSLDEVGLKTPYTENNSLVTKWSRGEYPIKQIRDKNLTVLGYSVTGGDKVEVQASEVTGKSAYQPKARMAMYGQSTTQKVGENTGTSYASPTNLGDDLVKKFGSACFN